MLSAKLLIVEKEGDQEIVARIYDEIANWRRTKAPHIEETFTRIDRKEERKTGTTWTELRTSKNSITSALKAENQSRLHLKPPLSHLRRRQSNVILAMKCI